MKMYKRLSAIILLACMLLSACGMQQHGSQRRFKVYMITKSLGTQFWASAVAGANAAKSEYNIDLVIQGPETEEDYAKQNEYIREAVRDGADAIVFSAISYSENAAAIDEAADAGVRIVVIDSDVDSHKVSARIGTDNVQAGRMTAAAVLNMPDQEINVGIVNFDLGSRNGQERELGLREVLQQDARVKQIFTVNVSATPDSGKTGAEILMKEHPEINALVGLNEPLAVGTARAVAANGLTGKVHAVGFDTNPECIDRMRDGAVSALIAQNPYAMGYLGVERAWELLEGANIDGEVWLDTATTIVTRDNMFTPESQKALFSFV